MTARLRPFRVIVGVFVGVFVSVGVAGCREPAAASVLVSFVNDGEQQSLARVRARLTLTDENGDHPSLRVLNIGADDERVTAVDVPLACNEVSCGGDLRVDAGSYDAQLILSAVDRCGARSDILAFAGAFEVAHWGNADLALGLDDASFDADSDGIIDVLEAASCGRFDFDEGPSPPRVCGGGRDACCAGSGDVEGGMQSFVGGSTTVPYGALVGGGTVAVSAFAIDASEVTFGQVERCVLAGACLQNRPEAPARLALEGGVDRRLPAQGLAPVDASAVCAFYGKVLPDDAAWDFAAADRGGVRARFPLDVDAGDVISCRENGVGPAAAHQAFEQDCPAEPLRVGSYTSSYSVRGSGTPVADLAGNVAEWTLVRGASSNDEKDDDGDGIPDDVIAVVLRGGGVGSFVQLLENDLPIFFEVASASDRRALAAAVPEAGFRCAAAAAPAVTPEPACPVVEDVETVDGDEDPVDEPTGAP